LIFQSLISPRVILLLPKLLVLAAFGLVLETYQIGELQVSANKQTKKLNNIVQ